MNFKGTIHHNDIGAGTYELHTEGKNYDLVLRPKERKVVRANINAVVEIVGTEEDGLLTAQMTGNNIIVVDSIL